MGTCRLDPVNEAVERKPAVRNRADGAGLDSHGRCRHVPRPKARKPADAAGRNEVLEPEGAHGPLVGWIGDNRRRLPERREPPPDDDGDVGPEELGLIRPVSHEYDRQAQPGMEVGQFLDGDCAGHGVERGERLVEEEDAGPEHDCTGDRGPLPLAPRERGRAPVGEVADLKPFECSLGLLPCPMGVHPPRPQAERDVLEDGEVGEEGVVLGDEGDSSRLGGKSVQGAPVQQDPP